MSVNDRHSLQAAEGSGNRTVQVGGHRMFTLTYNTGMALQSGTADSADSVLQEINEFEKDVEERICRLP